MLLSIGLICQYHPIHYLKFTQSYFLPEIFFFFFFFFTLTLEFTDVVQVLKSELPPFLLSECFACMVLKQFVLGYTV